MNQRTFIPLSLRPHWMQLIISQMPYILLCLAVYVGAAIPFYCWASGLTATILYVVNLCLLYIGLALTCYLLYKVLYFSRMEYVITGDQIIFLHGVVNHSTDYMELYRVIDYQQHRSLLQQMCKLKTVVIYSGDRNMPVMNIIGIREQVNVVAEIRNRVEFNKKLKHIYEITNRP